MKLNACVFALTVVPIAVNAVASFRALAGSPVKLKFSSIADMEAGTHYGDPFFPGPANKTN